MEDTVKRLVDKSIESFLMAIEVYNKPTIHYRIEGFSMFICNAWELLLKAQLFVQHYGIKSNPKLCYSYNVTSHPMYSYSMATIDLIVMEIEKDPENILRVLKERSKKKETPGAKDSKQ